MDDTSFNIYYMYKGIIGSKEKKISFIKKVHFPPKWITSLKRHFPSLYKTTTLEENQFSIFFETSLIFLSFPLNRTIFYYE